MCRRVVLGVLVLLVGGCGYTVDAPPSFEEQAAQGPAPESVTAPVASARPTATEFIDPLDQGVEVTPDAQLVVDAWERTVAEGTVSFVMDHQVETGTGTPAAYRVEGFADLEERRSRTTVSGDGLQPSQSITDETGTWWRDPSLPPETPWRFLTPDDLLATFGSGAAPDDGQLAVFSGFPQSVVQAAAVGREDLGGRPVTHYDTVVDLESAARANGRPSMARQLLELGEDTLPMDVWVDDEGRIARQIFLLDFVKGNDVPEIVATVDYTDYGVAADFTPPPQEQVLVESAD